MINKIVNTLLEHLFYQVNFASNAKSAFLDNAKEDSLNILLVLKAVQRAKHTPVNSVEIADDLCSDIENLKDNTSNFSHDKKYVLNSIKYSKLSINKALRKTAYAQV